VDAAIEKIEQIWPKVFNYYIFEDPSDVKGRLEVTLFKGETELSGEMAGTLVHSKE
jgi:hypothetical protein